MAFLITRSCFSTLSYLSFHFFSELTFAISSSFEFPWKLHILVFFPSYILFSLNRIPDTRASFFRHKNWIICKQYLLLFNQFLHFRQFSFLPKSFFNFTEFSPPLACEMNVYMCSSDRNTVIRLNTDRLNFRIRNGSEDLRSSDSGLDSDITLNIQNS